MDLLNTHYYDSKLLERVKPIRALLDQTRVSGDRVSEMTYIEQMTSSRASSTTSSKLNLSAIIRDDSNNPRQNYDATNDLNAGSILYLFGKYIRKDEEVCDLLNIQLDEMSSGMCAQGRTHRLLQILLPLIES